MATSADGFDLGVWYDFDLEVWRTRAPMVADETMNPAQLELVTEYLQRIEAQLDRVELNLRSVVELVERVAGQPVQSERGLGH